MNAPFNARLATSPDVFASVLGPDAASRDSYRRAMMQAVDVALDNAHAHDRPYAGNRLEDLMGLVDSIEPFPDTGLGTTAIIDEVGRLAVRHALAVSHPRAVAHLHCPVAVPALAAEALISVTNQSLDSWDQSPFATLVEERVVRWLAAEAGLGEAASGSFTSGASQSNMTALHLAAERCGLAARHTGVIFTSVHAHFSVVKSARILGFAADAVVTVDVDSEGRMRPEALSAGIEKASQAGRPVVAIVATAGTTDLGAIDPLEAIADLADRHGIFLHVDAAYGGGLLFSRHKKRLAGLERARSIALDFHKMLFQPISCGVLLVADKADFLPLGMKADYLNPEEAVFEGAPNLVEHSFQTTRRADALKVLMTARALGRDGLDALICRTLENASAAAEAVTARAYLELARQPSLSTVVFRTVSASGPEEADEKTNRIRARLFETGVAALATTVLDGRVHFKLTLLNPRSTPDVVNRVLDAIGDVAKDMETNNAD